ncbi:MAG: GGDEF domain-containing protein [Thiobacillaceae bacterium]
MSGQQYVSTTASRALTYLAVVLGLIAVGMLDYITGLEVHVVSLYFIPLALAGWRLGRLGAAISSLLSTVVWLAMLYANGAHYVHPYIWLVNFLTQGAAFLVVSMLIALLSEALRKEQSHSRTDYLTGLRNRLAFVEQARLTLSLCRRNARPVALAYIDLDNFKSVNDSLGHARGDALLQKCGTVIAESLRATDIAARIGGDEFVVFLPETKAEDAETLLERLLHALEACSDFRSVGVTASIGIVAEAAANSDIDQLLKEADIRMYRAKREGRNRIGMHHLQNDLGRR